MEFETDHFKVGEPTPTPEGLFLVDAGQINPVFLPGKAKEMQARRESTYRANRVKGQELSKARRDEAVAETRKAIDEALTNPGLDDQTIESLSDQIVFRTAKIILLGGETFLPLTVKECLEQATAWSKIAASETGRRRGKVIGEIEPEPVVDHRTTLAAVHKRMRERARQRALDQSKPG